MILWVVECLKFNINKLIKLYIKSKRGKTIKLVGYDGGVIKELAENEYINSQIRKKNLRR